MVNFFPIITILRFLITHLIQILLHWILVIELYYRRGRDLCVARELLCVVRELSVALCSRVMF